MSSWSDYVIRVARTDVATAIADRIGVSQPSVSRWLKSEQTPSPAHAAKFAVSYGVDVLEAFVAAGFLTPEEAGWGDWIDQEIARLTEERDFAARAFLEAKERLERAELELAIVLHDRQLYPANQGQVRHREPEDVPVREPDEWELVSIAEREAEYQASLAATLEAEDPGATIHEIGDRIEGHEPPMDAAAHTTGRESEKQRMMREQDEAAERQD